MKASKARELSRLGYRNSIMRHYRDVLTTIRRYATLGFFWIDYSIRDEVQKRLLVNGYSITYNSETGKARIFWADADSD
jgi:hypothetical protein